MSADRKGFIFNTLIHQKIMELLINFLLSWLQICSWSVCALTFLFDLNIFYFIYMKRDWAEHRCYVKALS